MGCSGYVDWHRLDHTLPWIRYRQGIRTYVFAFWTVHYAGSAPDHGLQLMKDEGRHPDWFLYAETVDHVLAAYPHPKSVISPNFRTVFDNGLQARPLLASVLLGTADAVYRSLDRTWWASVEDLTWRGKRLVKQLNRLYERECSLITFVENATDERSGPRDPS